MNKLIKYFNEKYGKEYGKVSYPRTTIQIYQVYQIIKSYGIEDEKLLSLLENVKLPKPKTTEEKEAYAECIYESVNIPASRKYVDGNFPKKTSIKDNKLYLLKENGEKIDQGTELPSLQEQIGENKTIQIFTDLATTEVSFDAGSTILQSLDTLIDTVDIQINQVFRGQSRAKDNPISGNCEIQIEILKTKSMSGARDIVCQITLTSTTDSPYKWIMLTRRISDDTSSQISVPLTPMIADVNKKYVDDKYKDTPSKTSIENNKLYLLKSDGTKLDKGTDLPKAQSVDLTDYVKKSELPKSASDVGADATGTATAKVTEHNASKDAHGDIRTLITDLTTKLNTLADSDDETLDQLSEIVTYIKNNKSLIDGITTNKVNVSDITDNLTTEATNKPLSAKQGKILKGLIDAITVPTKTSQLTNDSKFLTSIPSEYITEAELTAKGYLVAKDISNKVDKVEGKGLSTVDFTTAYETKLKGLSNYNDTKVKEDITAINTKLNTMFSFNDNGELVVTINGVSKTFVPKSEVTQASYDEKSKKIIIKKGE